MENPNHTLVCPLPSDVNGLPSIGFQFNVTKLPGLSFWGQRVNLPELSLGEFRQGTPLSDAYIPGDKLTFQDLELTFLVDANMGNYQAIHNWLVALGFPEDHSQYASLQEEEESIISELATNFSDGTLNILSASNNVAKSVHFVDLFPTSLAGITFDSTQEDVVYVAGTVRFRYSYYKFL